MPDLDIPELDPLSCPDPDAAPAGGLGWGLTAEEYAANIRDWYSDEAADVRDAGRL